MNPPIASEGGHRKPRTLVLCFDGTANEFNHRNTNVVKLYSILKKDRPDMQLCYYQAGIGTYFQPGVVSPLFRFAARVLDEAFAWCLSEHIMDGYKFLMQNYHEGDSVCIFGFSRGAYTARALAGMLHKVGLLSKDNFEQVAFAYKLYKSSSHRELAVRFRRSFSREVPIEFLGVWDTVASVGLFSTRTLPFVGVNNTIRVFRQALSLDERRAKFCPNLYHRPVSAPGPHSPQTRSEPLLKRIVRALETFTNPRRSRDTPHSALDLDPNGLACPRKRPGFKKDVKEVWFAGAHSDVGGGLAKDTEMYALSNIPLRWMVREIANAECNILFDEAALEAWDIPITMAERMPIEREVSDSTLHGDKHSPGKATSDECHVASAEREANVTTSTDPSASTTCGKSAPAASPSPEAEPSLDAEDAVQKMDDALKYNIFWWIVEIVPTYHEWQNEHDEWVGKWRLHLGRGRKLPTRPLFHESVKIRMDNPILNYSPRARYKKGTEVYVV